MQNSLLESSRSGKIHALLLYSFGRFSLINIVSPSNNEVWIDAVALYHLRSL
jgi:hypothetical protein